MIELESLEDKENYAEILRTISLIGFKKSLEALKGVTGYMSEEEEKDLIYLSESISKVTGVDISHFTNAATKKSSTDDSKIALGLFCFHAHESFGISRVVISKYMNRGVRWYHLCYKSIADAKIVSIPKTPYDKKLKEFYEGLNKILITKTNKN